LNTFGTRNQATSVGAQSEADHTLDCYDGPFDDAAMDGCVDGIARFCHLQKKRGSETILPQTDMTSNVCNAECSAFETLKEAEEHCNSLADCNGIVKTAYGDPNALRLGVGLYEVRQGPEIS
jgi:hypothetical protein